MDTIQRDKTVTQIVKGIQNHRHFDDVDYIHEDAQLRKDLDRATMTVQILLSIVSDMTVIELRDTLLRAGFQPTTVGEVMSDFPYIY